MKFHTAISFTKSFIRLVACWVMFHGHVGAAAIGFAFAEGLGVIEELKP